jgi:hypothetical protein
LGRSIVHSHITGVFSYSLLARRLPVALLVVLTPPGLKKQEKGVDLEGKMEVGGAVVNSVPCGSVMGRLGGS